MVVILSIETSGKNCSVAIHQQGELVITEQIDVPQSHAAMLAVLVDEVMRKSDLRLNELNALALSSGPGSYTGLRIGTATAKGLCYGLGIPLISIGTLDLLSFQVKKNCDENDFLCAMIDARRMEVYCKMVSFQGQEIIPMTAMIVDEKSFEKQMKKNRVYFFGDGAMKCRDIINHPNAFFIENVYPRASFMGQLAFEKFLSNRFVNISDFEPDYLKEFLIRPPKAPEAMTVKL